LDHAGSNIEKRKKTMGKRKRTIVPSEATLQIQKEDEKKKNEALKYFSAVMLNTAMGQILDIELGDSIIVAKYKTAKYTISGPLVLGATLAGLDPTSPRLRGVDKFGENLGIAFQIQDDILDSEVDWLGGMDSAKKEAEKYKNKALKILPQLTKDKEMSKLLQHLAKYLVERTK